MAILGLALQVAPKSLARYLGYPLVILGAGALLYGFAGSEQTTAAPDQPQKISATGGETTSSAPPIATAEAGPASPVCPRILSWSGSVTDGNGATLATHVRADFENAHYAGHDVSVPGNNFDFWGRIDEKACVGSGATLKFEIKDMHPYPNDSVCELHIHGDDTAVDGHCDTAAGYRAWTGEIAVAP